ncbi:MAG: hypothetical protein H6669_04140 [Ardenticatenaceae bacterium]|nr:hypothetical protein [Ardenticatenaceae bacterium]
MFMPTLGSLLSLVSPSTLIDLYEFGQNGVNQPSIYQHFLRMMTARAFGLIFGPGCSHLVLVPQFAAFGRNRLGCFTTSSNPARRPRCPGSPGMLHLIYILLLDSRAPVLVARVVLLQVPGIPSHNIEANNPQAEFTWVHNSAMLLSICRRVFCPRKHPKLGGRFSLVTVHLGGISLWASIFAEGSLRGILHGSAYLLWALSLLPIVYELWQIVRSGMERAEVELATAD